MPDWLADAIRESPPAGRVAFLGLPVAAIVLAVVGVVPPIIAVGTVSGFAGVLWSVRRHRTRPERSAPPK